MWIFLYSRGTAYKIINEKTKNDTFVNTVKKSNIQHIGLEGNISVNFGLKQKNK